MPADPTPEFGWDTVVFSYDPTDSVLRVGNKELGLTDNVLGYLELVCQVERERRILRAALSLPFQADLHPDVEAYRKKRFEEMDKFVAKSFERRLDEVFKGQGIIRKESISETIQK